MTFFTPDIIKRIREQLQVTQEQFAHQIGVTTRTIARWEHGSSIPRSQAVIKILTRLYAKLV